MATLILFITCGKKMVVMMNNRSRTDIIAKILESATNGVGITKSGIMHKAFVNSEQLKNYLDTLLESGLIEYNNKNSV
jgi:predicted transcriptional regulator